MENQRLVMGKFKNTQKESFLDSIPTTSLDSDTDKLTLKCKFNFAYFNASQDAGQNFSDWNRNELTKLLDKLKNYSENSLEYWKTQTAGKHSIFSVYEIFPKNSDFEEPKNIPHQVKWARFHVENLVRLVGFVIPDSYHGNSHPKTKETFDKNTFYIVFLDKNHKFYKMNK